MPETTENGTIADGGFPVRQILKVTASDSREKFMEKSRRRQKPLPMSSGRCGMAPPATPSLDPAVFALSSSFGHE
jgi:hypothetical protein